MEWYIDVSEDFPPGEWACEGLEWYIDVSEIFSPVEWACDNPADNVDMMEVGFDCVSTADDAALSTTSCKYPHSTADDAALKGSFQDLKMVTLEFDNEKVIIDTDVLPTKASWEKIDDPNDSVYIPSTDTNTCTEDEYYTFYMRRINVRKSSTISDDFSDDEEIKNRFVESEDENCSRPLKKRRVIETDEESNDGLAVDVGDILSYNISENDHHLLECVKDVLTSPRGWDSVQFVPYKSYLGGLYNLWSSADLHEMNPFIDGLLKCLGCKLDETDLEKLQHYATFLSSYFNRKTKRYEQSVQCYHRDFLPKELACGGNDWYIVFIPLTQSGMQLQIRQGGVESIYNIPYGKGAIMNAKTVHAGGFCNDATEGNLRMQLHISIDRDHSPLPIDIIQERFEDYPGKNVQEVSL